MKHLYYYVPPCPMCGSRRTGRYVIEPRNAQDARYTMEQSLAHGELIRFCARDPFRNCYCEDCGYEWPANIHGTWVDGNRVAEEMDARDTVARYAAFEEENPKKKKTIFGKIFGFFS